MSTQHTVRVEFDTHDAVDQALVHALAAYHPATARGPRGHVTVQLTLPADDVVQAVQTAVGVAGRALPVAILSVQALPTAESDRRVGLGPVPELVSVSEAARLLGVTRQAVLQRIESGSLPADRVGRTYAIQRTEVDRLAARQSTTGRSLAAAAGAWEGVGRWPESDEPARTDRRPDPLDPLPLPPGANIGPGVV